MRSSRPGFTKHSADDCGVCAKDMPRPASEVRRRESADSTLYDAHGGIDDVVPAPIATRRTFAGDRLIDASVVCTVCGSSGVGTCACWTPCPCGWSYRTGERCRNPKHGRRAGATIAAGAEGQGVSAPDRRDGAAERKGGGA